MTDLSTNTPQIIDGVLICPACGHEYTHHRSVNIYHRQHEDGDTIITRVSGARVLTEIGARENPSRRRDAIGIVFNCEGCECISELAVVQHKGQTFLRWHRVEKNSD